MLARTERSTVQDPSLVLGLSAFDNSCFFRADFMDRPDVVNCREGKRMLSLEKLKNVT